MHDTSLEIVASKATHGKTKLTAKLDGEVIAIEEIKVGQSKERKAFAKQLIEANPGLADHEDDIVEKLLKIASDDLGSDQRKPNDEPEPTAEELLDAMPLSVKQEAMAMLQSSDLMDIIVRDVHALGVAGEERLIQQTYLVSVSRLLDKPLACIIQGPSSTGKSFVPDKTSLLFPPETIIHATQMTPQSLFHMKPGSLRHRYVKAGERSRKENDDTAEATRCLREMLSSGRLSKLMPDKTNGTIETRMIEQDGPIAYTESTTLARIFDEDRNRCLLLNADETEQQTERIVRSIAQRAASEESPTEIDSIILRHHAAQRMLKPMSVSVPFAHRLADAFGSKRVECRRAFPLFLAAVKAVALLHQKHRKNTEEAALIATLDDYAIARNLFGEAVERSLGLILSPGAKAFRKRMFDRFGHEKWTAADAVRLESFGRTTVYGWIAELADHGDIEKVEDGAWTQDGKKSSTWRFSDDIVERYSVDGDPDPPPMIPPPESLR